MCGRPTSADVLCSCATLLLCMHAFAKKPREDCALAASVPADLYLSTAGGMHCSVLPTRKVVKVKKTKMKFTGFFFFSCFS